MVVVDAHVFLGFLTPALTQLSFQRHRLLFSHASAEVIGENMTERKFASTGSQTHNHQVMGPYTPTTEPPRRGKNRGGSTASKDKSWRVIKVSCKVSKL